MRIRALLVALVATLHPAAGAQAATLTLKPQIEGAGTITGASYKCDRSTNLDDRQTVDCPSTTLSGFVVAPLSLIAQTAGGDWQVDRWTGCDAALATTCSLNGTSGVRT